MNKLLFILFIWLTHTLAMVLATLACFALIANVSFAVFVFIMGALSAGFIQLLLNALPAYKKEVD